jgi:F420-0:gamma-glutamyl ligase-like protein
MNKKAIDITEQVANENTITAVEEAIDIVKKEYGDYTVSEEMRKELEKELGVDEDVAKGWKKVSDILDHIDIYEIAKKHPEGLGKVARGIGSIVGLFISPVGRIADRLPDEAAAKIVGFAGFLAPEHLLNMIAKDQVKRAKKKKENQKKAEKQSKLKKDSLAKMKEAKDLFDAGVLTEEEFAEIKAKLIAEL